MEVQTTHNGHLLGQEGLSRLPQMACNSLPAGIYQAILRPAKPLAASQQQAPLSLFSIMQRPQQVGENCKTLAPHSCCFCGCKSHGHMARRCMHSD